MRPPSLAPAAALSALLAAACGGPEPPAPADETAPPGFWFAARERPDVDLGALGYAPGTRPAAGDTAPGAHIVDAARVAPGDNLYCSGHAPEALRIDAGGQVLERWSVDYDALTGVPPMQHDTQRAWRRVRALPDGGLLALHEALALLRLDADSRLVWSIGEGAHHDFDVAPDGSVHLLVRRAVEHPEIARGRTVVDDGVLVIAPDGTPGRRVSILEALHASPWSYLLDDVAAVPGGRTIDPGTGLARDLLHVNAYALLDRIPDGLDPVFRAGRALICMRELDAVALLDLDEARIVWLFQGSFDAPHDPELDDAGHLWVFDNGLHRGWSRAVAIDLVQARPTYGQEVRQWPARPGPEFFSEVCGALQVLPGGNLLLTESTAGRAVEVSPEGDVVWRFATPQRVAGPDGPLVACLFELERLP